jgi:serine/threonine protein phosphatase 1
MYCVGDIHGRADLLIEIQSLILADAAAYPGSKWMLYLGDYIDRGMQSRQVIDLLLNRPLPGFDAIHLRGNHEQALMDFLRHPQATAAWLEFGGLETLSSYGVNPTSLPLMQDLDSLAGELDAVLPDAHREFFESTQLSWTGADYHFVHAGIRPGVKLKDQHPEDQLWIREEFTHSLLDHGVVVVHGHTITSKPELLPNRIGLDTGAFHSGVLTCLVLEGTEQRILQTGNQRE